MAKQDMVSVDLKDNYKITNWPAYNKSLEQRGRLSIYICDDDVYQTWYDDGPAQQGGQYKYSDQCIETILLLKSVFTQAYRQIIGLTKNIFELMKLDLQVPSYTQVCRRAEHINIEGYKIPRQGGLVLAIDSTGLKVYGEGEWKVRKHGYSKRRTWRKLHLGVDPSTGFIHCSTVTENDIDDGSQLESLLKQVDQKVEVVMADGAYDHKKCWDLLEEGQVWGIIPPRKNAQLWPEKQSGKPLVNQRNRIVKEVKTTNLKEWKRQMGYHQRSLSETAMFRYKIIFGDAMFSRCPNRQVTESRIKIKALNIMTAQGMPQSIYNNSTN